MKKTLSLLLALSLALTLTACEQQTETNPEITDTPSQTEQTSDSEKPAESTTSEAVEKPDESSAPEESSTPEESKPEESSAPEETEPVDSEPEDTFPETIEPEETTPPEPTEPEITTPPQPEETTPPETSKPEETTPPEEPENKTMGQTLLSAFKASMDSNPEYTPAERAQLLMTNDVIQFMGGAYDVAPGWLQGFDNEISGFASGAGFGPMIGSIAFVGYVFELDEGADVSAFKATLKSNANPRWQICVQADETIIESVGNTVFFLMCPSGIN